MSNAAFLAALAISPSSKDWRVRFTFTDGTTKTMRVAPGRIPEDLAVRRAKISAKIFDDSILDRVDIERWGEDHGQPFGIIQKKD